jgi:aspartyl protease
MPCLWLQHNNSQLFVNVGIIDPTAFNPAAGPLQVGNFQAPPMFRALVDTGAQKTMISTNVVNTLRLTPRGQIPVQGIGPNVTYHNGYLFHVAFTLPIAGPAAPVNLPAGQMQVLICINPVQIYGAELPVGIGFDVLLGMDVLSSGSLKIEGSGHFSFSF